MPNVNESQLPVQVLGSGKYATDVNESQLPVQVIAKNIPDECISQSAVQVLLSVGHQQPRIFISS